MSDTKALVRAAAPLFRARAPMLIATVVRVRGSSYRRPGARMLLSDDEWVAGSVSGGCLEKDVVRKAWWYARQGPVVVSYDLGADDGGAGSFGLGCGGAVDLLLERLDPGALAAHPIRFFERCIERQEQGAIATVFRSDAPGVPVGARACVAAGWCETRGLPGGLRERVVRDARATLGQLAGAASLERAYQAPGGAVEVLLERVVPPVRLFVLGTGHDAVPLVELAHAVGWEVVVCTAAPRSHLALSRRFSAADAVAVEELPALAARIDGATQAMVVIMAHDYARDRDALGMLLRSRARYIGLLGPRARSERMLADLGRPDIRAIEDDDRIHAPVGLELGAETPREIALAIVAEVQAVFARAAATSLRGRRRPIHDEEPARQLAPTTQALGAA